MLRKFREGKLSQVNTVDKDSSEINKNQSYAVFQFNNKASACVEFRLGKHCLLALCDSGSELNLIDSRVLGKKTISKCTKRLKCANGTGLEVTGETQLHFKVAGC